MVTNLWYGHAFLPSQCGEVHFHCIRSQAPQEHYNTLLLLQVSFAQQFPAMNTDSDTWTHQKLKFTVTKDVWEQSGPLGGVFSTSHDIARRMNRLQLTDVEISLLAALLLFCSGTLVNIFGLG